ncbi:hypothetical protein [Flammeovirga sp. OC4]|uniref:hypothetical protein n=1 Tax=Flammeovirga sp. OC4 TaxID=1382345 RepID=UPI0005C5421B|nr:hypothetical protein [Flammeovirga sp. OC4]
MLRKSIIILVAFLLNSCLVTENVLLTQEELDQHLQNLEDAKFKAKNVAVAIDHSIYFYDIINQPPHLITNETSTKKRDLKVNQDNTKFAYLNDDDLIEIIDQNGSLLAVLEEYSNVQTFDWIEGGKTLYILNGQNVKLYGNTTLEVPAFENLQGYYEPEIKDISVSSESDFAFWVTYGYGYTTRNAIHIVKSNGETLYDLEQVDVEGIAFSPMNDLIIYKDDWSESSVSLEIYNRDLEYKDNLYKYYAKKGKVIGPIYLENDICFTYVESNENKNKAFKTYLKLEDRLNSFEELPIQDYEYFSMDSKSSY